MRILDRYVLRQYVQIFLIAFCSLTGLFVVMDAFNHLDEFNRFAPQHGGLLRLLADYYSYNTLYIFDRTCGVLLLLAGMFTLAWLQRHNELTAIQAAGVPTGRIVRPVLLAVAAIVGLAAVNREVIIPACRHKLSRTAQDLAGTVGKRMDSRYDNQTNILFRGKETFSDGQRISEPNFLLPRELSAYGKQLAAESASYQPAAPGRPAGFRFHKLESPRDLAGQRSLTLGGRPVVITPRDAPWLGPDECFVASSVTFEQLQGGAAWRQFSSTKELISSLRNPSLDLGADVKVAIHTRVVQPLLDLTLVMLGLPLVVSRPSGNVFVVIGLCVALVAAFVLVALGCQFLGNAGWFSPALASWLPLILFVPCAVGLCEPLWQR